MMKKILLVAAAALLLLMPSCGSGLKVEMDNPTDQTITVAIDSKEYNLAPMQLIEVPGLKKGPHTMSVNGGAEMNFNLDENALLNPTLSLYVTDVQEYSTDGGDMDTSDWVTVEIDGEEYEGPIKLYENQLVISMDGIKIGLLEKFPEEVETLKNGSIFMTKIFRKADYPKYYEEAYY
ncbi:MAG: hypothetical protein LUD68_04625 [Rikenellaceae bacterium]|nr:hypothetical protein [Rikenellaceae bacterium]